MYKKNTAVVGFPVGLRATSGNSDITTGTPVGYVTLDGGTQTAIADVTPVHKGNGQWTFNLTAAEMNGDTVGLVFTHASAITEHIILKTEIITTLATGTSSISTAASNSTITVGSETLTFAATTQLDGLYHEISDVGGQIDSTYHFDVGGAGIGTEVTFTGRLNGSNDVLGLFAYNWDGASWDQIGSIQGDNSTVDVAGEFNILASHTGTGVNSGKVDIRAYTASGLSSATMYLDQVYLSYAVVSQTVGYALGRIWVNTDAANTNTELYVDGVADNPVGTMAAAKEIADNMGIKDFHITSNSSITLIAPLSGYNVFGVGYSLDFGGQDVGGTHFYHSSPSNGVAEVSIDHLDHLDSIINNVTSDDAHHTNCIFIGTYTFGTDGTAVVEANTNHCKSGIAGSSSPIFTKTAGSTLTWSVRDWKGGMTINGLEAGDKVTIGGGELGTITFNGADAEVEVRGIAKAVTNNLTGSPAINLDGLVIASDVDDIKTTIGIAGAGLTSVPKVDANIVEIGGSTDSANNLKASASGIVVSSVNDAAGSVTSFIIDSTVTVDNHFGERLLIFTSGLLANQATSIEDYDGETKRVTVTALTSAPANGVSFVIV